MSILDVLSHCAVILCFCVVPLHLFVVFLSLFLVMYLLGDIFQVKAR